MSKKKILTKRGWLLVAVIVATGCLWIFSIANSKANSTIQPIETHESSASPIAQTEKTPRLLVRVWIHNEDLYPNVVRVRPGAIYLRAENETLGDVALAIESDRPGQAPVRLASLRTSRQEKRVSQEIQLGVGEYVFYEESRPELRGTLIVEAN